VVAEQNGSNASVADEDYSEENHEVEEVDGSSLQAQGK